MLSYRTITPHTLELLTALMREPVLASTRLVGGTALALQLGHRTSIDLDLFGSINCDEIELHERLRSLGNLEIHAQSRYVKLFTLDGVKLDIVIYPYPWLQEAVIEDGIRLAAKQDIAAMKINAITGRGSRKDFVDLYFLLQQYSLNEIMEWHHLKYPEASDFATMRSLTYFDDAELQPMPMMMDDNATWNEMKRCIRDNVESYMHNP